MRGEEILSGAQRVHDPQLLTERAIHHQIGKRGLIGSGWFIGLCLPLTVFAVNYNHEKIIVLKGFPAVIFSFLWLWTHRSGEDQGVHRLFQVWSAPSWRWRNWWVKSTFEHKWPTVFSRWSAFKRSGFLNKISCFPTKAWRESACCTWAFTMFVRLPCSHVTPSAWLPEPSAMQTKGLICEIDYGSDFGDGEQY